MNWEMVLMESIIVAIVTCTVTLVGIVIMELGIGHKFSEKLTNVDDGLKKDHNTLTSSIKELDTSFTNFVTDNKVAENEKKHRYKRLKNKQKEVVDSIEKLSDFSKLLQEQEQTIVALKAQCTELQVQVNSQNKNVKPRPYHEPVNGFLMKVREKERLEKELKQGKSNSKSKDIEQEIE